MDELQISIPSDNLPERKYIVQTLVGDFLGLSYKLITSDVYTDYTIQLKNKKIVIKDAFFHLFKESLTYLDVKNIPQKVSWFSSSQLFDKELPIIYGHNNLKIENETIYVGLDIFASSFYMLSRWEEVVLNEKDTNGRCAEGEMFIVKNNLFNRPIVNEYCTFLRVLLMHINVVVPAIQRKFEALITHDVDFLFRFGSIFSIGQNLAGDLFLRKSIKTGVRTVSNYLRFKRGEIKDPFDTFDDLMDISEESNLKSSFYFKPSIQHEKDSTYSIFDKRVIAIIKNIVRRGHEVGIHPSKNTFHNLKQLKTEYNRLTSIGVPVSGGRQHYLLYDVNETFGHWEEAGLTYDCGLGFHERAGFRCGICWPFRIFDLKNRKVLNLFQKPLSVMEVALIRWKPAPDILFESILSILNEVKKHSGLFVFLWHNDSFNRPEYFKYTEIYRNVLKSI